MVTRWKPELRWVATCGNSLPHTTFLRTHRPVRHLLICRAEAQTVDLTYTSPCSSLLCRSRVPATSVLPVTPPLLHFITRPRIPGQSSFRQGQPESKAGQLESQAIHAAGNNVTINPAPVDDNRPHLSLLSQGLQWSRGHLSRRPAPGSQRASSHQEFGAQVITIGDRQSSEGSRLSREIDDTPAENRCWKALESRPPSLSLHTDQVTR